MTHSHSTGSAGYGTTRTVVRPLAPLTAVVAAAALLVALPVTARGEGGDGETVTARAERPAEERERERINPCNTPDPGFGIYDRWSSVAMGQMLAPHRGGLTRDGGFDLVVHFHGHEPIRKEFVKVARGQVLVGIDLGIGSGPYDDAFAAPDAFPRLLRSVEEAMKKHSGREKVHVRKIALSSWSAGYGAISEILRQPIASKIDAVILLDSLHAGYTDAAKHAVNGVQIAHFVERARAAASGHGFMFLSHSSIVPPGYASTTEVARYVVGELGGRERSARRHDVLGLELLSRYDRGNFHVRGYAGNDKPDHCAQIGLFADVLKVHVLPRWHTPAGHGP